MISATDPKVPGFMKRAVFHLPWLVGLLLLLGSLLWGAGAALPYQDGTPELLLRQQEELRHAMIAIASGALLFFGGLACLGVSALRRRSRRHEVKATKS